MLSRKAVQPLCKTCRLDLFSLYVHGLSSPAKFGSASIPRSRTLKIQPRAFRTVAGRRDPQHDTYSSQRYEDQTEPPSAAENEAKARKARDIYGHTLPANLLSSQEYQAYERLYGAPLRESTTEDIQRVRDELEADNAVESEESGNLKIFRQNTEGDLEAVEEEFDEKEENEDLNEEYDDEDDIEEEGEGDEEGGIISAEDQASIKARQALRLDMLAAERRHYIESGELSEDDASDAYGPRTHPYTELGRCGTQPFSITMPRRTFIDPISRILETTSRKQLMESARKTFGGRRLQDSIATPVKAKAEHFQQKPIALEAVQMRMSDMEANSYLAVNMPGAYASVMSILVECRKRLGSEWLEELLAKEDGPRILDAGAAGAGVLAWQDVLRAEWARLNPEVRPGDPVPFGKSTVITGSSELRSRVRPLLDNTTFIPRMPEFVPTRDLPGAENHDPSLRKQYDIIIAAHSLWTLKEDYMRKAQVQNYFTLLNPNGGVLIILEKGVPRGFELVAGARDTLLKHHISSPGEAERSVELTGLRTHKEPGMIIAPCTNHGRCPMYPDAGQMIYRKDWCHFSQRFVRPQFLQDILGKTHRNHEDIQYSYVAVRRGMDERPQKQEEKDEAATLAALKGYEKAAEAPHALSLPRILLPPLKRHGHVVLDVCTPGGKMERWTTTKTFSRQSYRDGRKSKWGDLWALGAKVRVIRQARTGHVKNMGKGKTPAPLEGDSFAKVDRNVSPEAYRDRSNETTRALKKTVKRGKIKNRKQLRQAMEE